MKGNGKAQHKERMKKNLYFLILLFAASVIFMGCEDLEVPPIVVPEGEVLNQTVYADDDRGESGVRIITTAPWRSEIREITTTAATETTRNAVDWVSIDPSSGGIGEHILTISLEVNHRGEDRSAEISIISGSTVITIIITQQGLTECGYVPPYEEVEECIRVDNESTLNQTVFANQVTGASICFTTLAPWTSSIREATADWVTISPDSGSAGYHTINILLTPNFTGADRSAIIAITSGSTTIEIRITQRSVTDCGNLLVKPEDHSIIRAENVVGENIDRIEMVRARVERYDENDEWRYLIIGEALFQNNGFTLQLNDVPESFLFPFSYVLPDNFEISDRDARIIVPDFFAFNRSINIGSFAYYEDRINEYEDYWWGSYWLYVDRDVTIRGTYREECGGLIVYSTTDLDLRKGWNIVYGYPSVIADTGENRVIISETTTQKPAGVNFRWHFRYWGDDGTRSSRSTTTRATENRMSFFRR